MATLAAARGIRSEQGAALIKMLELNSRDGGGGGGQGTWQDPWKILVYDAYCRDIISPLLNVGDQRNDAGLVPRLVAALFVAIKCDVRHVYKVKTSFLQIYNEQIDDLLRPKGTNLRVKPRGHAHEVEGLAEVTIRQLLVLLGGTRSGRSHLRGTRLPATNEPRRVAARVRVEGGRLVEGRL